VGKRMGIGVLVRDATGAIIATLSKNVKVFQDPTTVEAMGALCAVEFSRDVGIQDIFIEGDSKLVIQGINSSSSEFCQYGHIVEDIKKVLRTYRKWEAGFVRQEVNLVAHGLAKVAINEGWDIIWLEETPNVIRDIVFLEHFALFP
jgi:ribonuclease HI